MLSAMGMTSALFQPSAQVLPPPSWRLAQWLLNLVKLLPHAKHGRAMPLVPYAVATARAASTAASIWLSMHSCSSLAAQAAVRDAVAAAHSAAG